MKIRMAFLVLIAIPVLILPACASAAKEVPLQATYEDFAREKNITREITVPQGNTVKLTVASNPTTGYKWNLAGISSPEVIAHDGESEYVPPETALVGAGGQEIWTFEALKRGTSRISLAYFRPWEDGAKAEWTLEILVTVK